MKLEAYKSSDYAGLEAGKFHFYFGYEETVCKKHKSQEKCEEVDCESREWAFTASHGGNELMRVSESELAKHAGGETDDVAHGLVLGIGKFMNKYGKDIIMVNG